MMGGMTDEMSDAREVAERYWAAAEARNWDTFGALVADDVVYEAPQTRERVRGRAAYVRFNVDGFPGDWHLSVERAVGDRRQAATVIRFENAGMVETGVCFFDLDDDGLISRITDWWPEPCDPPAGRAHLAERW
jgi:ketosteroid isomerase-like protein